jgi:hypothetical protein
LCGKSLVTDLAVSKEDTVKQIKVMAMNIVDKTAYDQAVNIEIANDDLLGQAVVEVKVTDLDADATVSVVKALVVLANGKVVEGITNKKPFKGDTTDYKSNFILAADKSRFIPNTTNTDGKPVRWLYIEDVITFTIKPAQGRSKGKFA